VGFAFGEQPDAQPGGDRFGDRFVAGELGANGGRDSGRRKSGEQRLARSRAWSLELTFLSR